MQGSPKVLWGGTDASRMYGKIQKLRFVAMGVSMALAALTFFVGALWIKVAHDNMDYARLEDAGREIRSRMIVLRQLLLADMAVFQFSDISLKTALAKPLQEKDLTLSQAEQFDFVAFFGSTHGFLGGLKRDGKEKPTFLKDVDVYAMIPADASLFDQAASEKQASGLLIFEGRPLLVGLRPLMRKEQVVGFVLAGRRLDTRRLVPTAGLSEQAFEVFLTDNKTSLPRDVEIAKARLQGDKAAFGKINRRSEGTGYLRFDDAFERPAFILRYPWVDAAISSERRMLAWLFVCAMAFGGLIHLLSSGSLTWFVHQRKQVPGIAGLSDVELRLTVEAFPGYMFALDEHQRYLGVSRSLTGLFDKEPAMFFGKTFGDVSGEAGMTPENVLNDLSNSTQWPAMSQVELSIQGLSKNFQFHATAYILKQRRIVLYMLRPLTERTLQNVAEDVSAEGAARINHKKEDIAA